MSIPAAAEWDRTTATPLVALADKELTGREMSAIIGLADSQARDSIVTAVNDSGQALRCAVRLRLETPPGARDLRYGILLSVLGRLA